MSREIDLWTNLGAELRILNPARFSDVLDHIRRIVAAERAFSLAELALTRSPHGES